MMKKYPFEKYFRDTALHVRVDTRSLTGTRFRQKKKE